MFCKERADLIAEMAVAASRYARAACKLANNIGTSATDYDALQSDIKEKRLFAEHARATMLAHARQHRCRANRFPRARFADTNAHL